MNLTDLEFNILAESIFYNIRKRGYGYFNIYPYVFTKKRREISIARLKFSVTPEEGKWEFPIPFGKFIFEPSITGDTAKKEVTKLFKYIFGQVIA